MSFAARSLWILHRIHLEFLRVELLEPELHFLLLDLLRVLESAPEDSVSRFL